MTIGVTGESGFIGFHLRQFITHKTDYQLVELGPRFQDSADKINTLDWIIHLAGKNRGENVYHDNLSISKQLIDILKVTNTLPNLIFISSTQEGNGSDYAKSKEESFEMFRDFYKNTQKKLVKAILPNIFGPFCKPNYNSFVSTFCNNLNSGIPVNIIEDKNVDLTYVEDACKWILSGINYNQQVNEYFTPSLDIPTQNFKVTEILEKLSYFKTEYVDNMTIPKLKDKFELNLFNTFRHFSNPVKTLTRRTDDRGYLVECLRSRTENSHFFYSITKPGITRGNHFHFNKIERFIVVSGRAEVRFNKVDEFETENFIISSDENLIIDIPVLKNHTLTNIGDGELICLFWTNEIFDEKNPDTYFKKTS